MTTTAPPTRRTTRDSHRGRPSRAPRTASSARREQEHALAQSRSRRREQLRQERGAQAARRARSLPGLIDLGAVSVLVLLAAAGLGPVWGGVGPARAVVGGLLLGTGLAWLAAVRRWGVLTTTALTTVAYVALGGTIALPHTTLAGVVPTLETLRGLLLGAVTVWKDWVTAGTPLSAYPDLALAPFLATLLVTVTAASLALRTRHGIAALAPVVVLFVAVGAGGSAEEAFPLVQGLGSVVLALGWGAWRARRGETPTGGDTRHGAGHDGGRDGGQATGHATGHDAGRDAHQEAQRAALRTRRTRGAAALLAGTAVVTVLVAPLLAPAGHRVVLRDVVVPPLELHDFSSPLAGFRSYAKDHAEDVLFTVEGLRAGERLRLATLDAYTGTVMDVAGGTPGGESGSFRRAGARLPAAPHLPGVAPRAGEQTSVTVTVGEYADVWVPVVGEPSAVTFEGSRAGELRRGLHLNPDGPTVLTTSRLAAGDRYTVTSTVFAPPTGTQLQDAHVVELALPAPQLVPDAVAASADRFAMGLEGGAATVQALRDGLASVGVLSSGRDGELPSRAGHGADRIATLLGATAPVGDDEQFAVAMALMARQRGIPARVVMGFFDDDAEDQAGDEPPGPVEVRGVDVRAWVEVPFTGIGWVPFDPRPDDDTPPQSSEARSQAQPQPQQLVQPLPPEEPEEPPAQPLPEDAEEDELETEEETSVSWLLVGAVAAGGLLVLALPFAVIMAVKARRRSRRRRGGATVDRVLGGWAEVVDLGRDLGHEPRSGATRRETGRGLAASYPDAGVVTLARHADAGVFGPGEPTGADVEALWTEVDTVLQSMGRSVGPWARLRAKVSPRSLRRARGGRVRS